MKIVPVEEIPTDLEEIPDDIVEVYKTCKRMHNLCRLENGVGLSAVQVGIPWKLFVVKDGERFRNFADCEYEPTPDAEKKLVTFEGCLSLPKRMFYVNRFDKVTIRGRELIESQDSPMWQTVEFGLQYAGSAEENLNLIVFQHEIDHHRGILISDIGEEVGSKDLPYLDIPID